MKKTTYDNNISENVRQKNISIATLTQTDLSMTK